PAASSPIVPSSCHGRAMWKARSKRISSISCISSAAKSRACGGSRLRRQRRDDAEMPTGHLSSPAYLSSLVLDLFKIVEINPLNCDRSLSPDTDLMQNHQSS